MLAKVITISHGGNAKGAIFGFGPVMRYIMRASPENALPEGQTLEGGHINIDDDDLFWTIDENREAYADDLAAECDFTADDCRRKGRFKSNPVYHVAINWQEGEYPTAKQAEHACRTIMRELGFAEHQAAWAIHRDTDNDHVHLVVNRVHPKKHIAIDPPFKKDYFILDRCMRELELEFGYGRANGPYITLDSPDGPKIVRMSRGERRARGLLKEDGPRISERARRAEINLGSEQSFQSWVAGAPAHDLKETLEKPGCTWADAQAALARHGVAIQAKGSGLVVTTTLEDGRVLAAKASQLGRWASKAELEKRLGVFVVAEPGGALPRVYAEHVEAALRGRADGKGRQADPRTDPGPDPAERDVGGRKRDPDQRAIRRQQRADARDALAQRFRTEQEQARRDKARQREELRERHRRERLELLARHRQSREQAYAAARRTGQPVAVAKSLWAWQAAMEREALQKRQAQERKGLSAKLPRSEVWRKWLARQSELGDEAAQAALRGTRYREQRKKNQEIDGIEGEELDPLRKLTVAALHAEVDRKRQRVIYRGSDGKEKFVDTGPRIEMKDRSAESLEAALRLAAQKYGGAITITGSAEFRERAAREAARLGIRVIDADLQAVVRSEREPQQPGTPQREKRRTARKRDLER
ncbi:relaxase/mobilization nuclease family protein [Burkholderiales bacterium GJ-E10]|nr:relaxase/mobilization nuclease family protein [Burkholderiales bacterium GJ-E10]